jgi:hypothetical protein
MIIGGISKTALDQVLTSFAITPGTGAVGLATRYIQGPLFFMSLYRSPMGRARALGT